MLVTRSPIGTPLSWTENPVKVPTWPGEEIWRK
jgi:hypothetical protein